MSTKKPRAQTAKLEPKSAEPCKPTTREAEVAGKIVERRRSKRYAVAWSGKINCGGTETAVKIEDISCGGVTLNGIRDLQPLQRLVIEIAPGTTLPGQLRWSKARRGGLAFDHPLDATHPLIRAAESEHRAAVDALWCVDRADLR